MKDNRTDEQILEDCIKRASHNVGITNNADNRMILEALIEKQIRDEKLKSQKSGNVDGQQVKAVLNAFGIPETKNIICAYCEESNGYDLYQLITKDNKLVNIFLCLDCKELSYQIKDFEEE